jgi:7-dehydrocholesterol reductase
MSWPLILLSFAAKQAETYGLSDSMIVAVVLQLIYVAKFFYWETGYLRSLDIMHDRAGYYICWGCLVWVPAIYSSSTLYLVNHPNHLGPTISLFIFTLGTFFIMINFLADRQRQRIRTTNGNCLIWFKTPQVLNVKYQTERGESKENLLLFSGWWGISRHFHYVPEVLGALCWSIPALFNDFMPYFYVAFLAVLLTERAFRDDERCADKDGVGWENYCKKVPYKIIPYII